MGKASRVTGEEIADLAQVLRDEQHNVHYLDHRARQDGFEVVPTLDDLAALTHYQAALGSLIATIATRLQMAAQDAKLADDLRAVRGDGSAGDAG